jgi:hypothetical protein
VCQQRNQSAMLWHFHSCPVRVRCGQGHLPRHVYRRLARMGISTLRSAKPEDCIHTCPRARLSLSKSGGECVGRFRVYIKPLMGNTELGPGKGDAVFGRLCWSGRFGGVWFVESIDKMLNDLLRFADLLQNPFYTQRTK